MASEPTSSRGVRSWLRRFLRQCKAALGNPLAWALAFLVAVLFKYSEADRVLVGLEAALCNNTKWCPQLNNPEKLLKARFARINRCGNKPIRIIVPFKGEGPTLATARLLEQHFSEKLGAKFEAIEIQNIPEYSDTHDDSMFAAEFVSGIDLSDGCTILLHNSGLLYGILQFDDLQTATRNHFSGGYSFQWIGRINKTPLVVIAGANTPHPDFSSLTRAIIAKEKIVAAHAGISSNSHKCLAHLSRLEWRGEPLTSTSKSYGGTALAVDAVANGKDNITFLCDQTTNPRIGTYRMLRPSPIRPLRIFSDVLVEDYRDFEHEFDAAMATAHGLYAPPKTNSNIVDLYNVVLRSYVEQEAKDSERMRAGVRQATLKEQSRRGHYESDAAEVGANTRYVDQACPAPFNLYKIRNGQAQNFVNEKSSQCRLAKQPRLQTADESQSRPNSRPASREEGRDCDGCPLMVVVPRGSFMMGTPEGEGERNSDEGPVRLVNIADDFLVGKYEVTFSEWASCAAEKSCREKKLASTDHPGHPVKYVTWEETQSFIKWLSTKAGKNYRLLTEAEWEYAARGVVDASAQHARFFFGDSEADLCKFANVADLRLKNAKSSYRVAYANCDDGFPYVAHVGQKAANPFGLHDMLGNVWEWVQDCYRQDYRGVPSNGTASAEFKGCDRVNRGGSWMSPVWKFRLGFRDRTDPRKGLEELGFRVARNIRESR